MTARSRTSGPRNIGDHAPASGSKSLPYDSRLRNSEAHPGGDPGCMALRSGHLCKRVGRAQRGQPKNGQRLVQVGTAEGWSVDPASKLREVVDRAAKAS